MKGRALECAHPARTPLGENRTAQVNQIRGL